MNERKIIGHNTEFTQYLDMPGLPPEPPKEMCERHKRVWTGDEFHKKWEIETKKTLEERARKAAAEEREKALNGGKKKKEKKEKKKKGKPEPEKPETFSMGHPCANHYLEYRVLWDRQCQEAWYRGAVLYVL